MRGVFFYSSNGSLSEIFSSIGKLDVGGLAAATAAWACASWFLFKALSNFFWVSSNEEFNIILDPHTAIGYGAFDKHDLNGNNIVLATAHPCKFPDAIQSAINIKAELPNELQFILNEKENYDVLENDIEIVKEYIKEKSKWK